MSNQQLLALLAKLKQDTSLKEKFQNADNIEAAVELANDAGFTVTKEDWFKFQAQQMSGLSDEELEVVAGGQKTATQACSKVRVHCDSARPEVCNNV